MESRKILGDLELRGHYKSIPTDEESIPNESENDDLMPRHTSSGNWSKLLLVSFVLAVLGAFALISKNKIQLQAARTEDSLSKTTPSSERTKSATTTYSTINYTFRRVGYPALSYFNDTLPTFMIYESLKSYKAAIEPYAEMEYYMYDETESNNYNYTICWDATSECQTGYWQSGVGSTIKFSCKPRDTFTIFVTELNATNNEVINNQEDTATCMYVRREIRTMSAQDQYDFMTTFKKMDDYDDETGRKLFGSNYTSSISLLKFHVYNTYMQDADHLHEGNGFLMLHLKLNVMFEASLQSMNPALTLPYWDWTLDSVKGATMDEAYIFRDSLMGNGTRPRYLNQGWTYGNDSIEHAAIASGLWKNAPTLMMPDGYEVNGYGYMRAPWSMNPSPWVSRFFFFYDDSEIPQCSEFYDLLQYDDLMDFFFGSDSPHAPIHGFIGGAYGCDLLDGLVNDGYLSSRNSGCNNWPNLLKQLWRDNVIMPKKNCSLSENIQDSYCGFTCNATAADFLSYLEDSNSESLNLDNGTYTAEVFYDFICDGGDGGRIFMGEQLEASSPSDPTFWLIHPILEKLYQAKLLAGGFATSDWASNSTEEYVCLRSTCYQKGIDDWVTNEDCCYGHYEDDQMYDGVAHDRSYYGMSNGKIQNMTDPSRSDYGMNYIYDSFEFAHCTEDFDTLYYELKMASVVNDDRTDDDTNDDDGKSATKTYSRPRTESQNKVIAKKAAIVAQNKQRMITEMAKKEALHDNEEEEKSKQ